MTMKTNRKLLLMALLSASVLSCWAGQNVRKFAVSQSAMLDRLMAYLAIESASELLQVGQYPMTEGQQRMAQKLVSDLRSLDAQVTLTEWGYVYVTIPSNIDHQVPSIGISCHLDCTPEHPHTGIKPKVIKYKGGVINLGHGTLDPSTTYGRDLPGLKGKTLVHSDGTTILGGDDKNGCAVVMSVIETVLKPGFKHGPLQFVFCPNEDIGMAALKIDTAYFNPDILLDVDGVGGHEIAVSNFTARELLLKFNSKDAHPSEAKAQQMGDGLAAAAMYIAGVPLEVRPEHTEGQQGYIHPWSMVKEKVKDPETGKDEEVNNYIVSTRIRFFDKAEGERFDTLLRTNLEAVKRAFPYVNIEVLRDWTQYDNVAYSMHPASIPLVRKAAKRCKIAVDMIEMRAGTTSAMFTARGLKGGLCIFSGQHNEHSKHEYSVLEEMYDAYMLLLSVIDESLSL